MGTVRQKLLFIPALGALVLAALAVGHVRAGADPGAPPAAAVVDEAVDEPGPQVLNCNGGAQEQALVTMGTQPFNLVENGAWVAVPNASVSFTTPANDTDQIIVIFTAEARLLGQPVTYTVPLDFLQIRILLDGVQMQPANDLTFTTVAGESNAVQTCKRVPADDVAVAHTVTVEYLLVDQSGAVLTGTIDDFALHVEVNN